ncbi:MAG: large-conductance mechanosensitive channel protein MscL [Chloroflexi bacterium]|nr:large-conductance mechanosensitive channel protein MscL [Chloroflexota bacterium]
MLQEFRKFIMRGNVIDLAVGVIIGAAFGAVVTSLVNDVIMPPIGLIVGGIDFSDIKIVLQAAQGESPEVAINIGVFLNAVINFLIVALAVFFMIRVVNRLQEMAERKKEEAPAAPAAPTTEELMLVELKAMREAMEQQK